MKSALVLLLTLEVNSKKLVQHNSISFDNEIPSLSLELFASDHHHDSYDHETLSGFKTPQELP